MRPHSPDLLEALTDGFSRRLFADVFHGSERVLQDLPLEGWSMDGDLSAEIKINGKATAVYQSTAGESLTPEGTEGILSPFRARILLLMEITTRTFSETINLGWFRITNIPYAQDQYAKVNGVKRVMSSTVDLSFESMDVRLKRWGFRSEQQPANLSSCYQELRRITNMPVTETLPDQTIPAAITYEATEGGRLKAVQSLAAVLGGRAVINPAGALVVVPDIGGEPVGRLVIGPNGTVTDVPYSVTTEGVYNCVVGNFEDADRNPIFEVATVNEGPLSINDADFGETTRYYTSEFVKTRDQAIAAVAAVLSQSTGQQNFDVPIDCIINPLFELGDVLEVVGHVRPLVGRLVKFSMSDSELMTVTLAVSRRL
jgi:hypothetical protein